jgi:hypothetical protein
VADEVVSAVAEWAAAVVSAREALSECRHFRETHFCTFACSVNFRPRKVRQDELKQS